MIKKLLLAVLLAVSLFSFWGTSHALAQEASESQSAPDSTCLKLTLRARYGFVDYAQYHEVRAVQDFLYARGYLKTQPDGYFGISTVDALKSFQIGNGISPVGFVGPETRLKIQALTCGSSSFGLGSISSGLGSVSSAPTANTVNKTVDSYQTQVNALIAQIEAMKKSAAKTTINSYSVPASAPTFYTIPSQPQVQAVPAPVSYVKPTITGVRGILADNFATAAGAKTEIDGYNLASSINAMTTTHVFIGGQPALFAQQPFSTLLWVIAPNLPTGTYDLYVATDHGTSETVKIKITNPSTTYIKVTAPINPSNTSIANWSVGETHSIIWQATGVDFVNISLQSGSDHGQIVNPIAYNLPASNGIYSWTIPSSAKGWFGTIFVSSTSGAVHDIGANINVVSGPSQSIQVTSQTGNEVWKPGEYHVVSWSASGMGNAPIYFYLNQDGSDKFCYLGYTTVPNVGVNPTSGNVGITLPIGCQLPGGGFSPEGYGSSAYHLVAANSQQVTQNPSLASGRSGGTIYMMGSLYSQQAVSVTIPNGSGIIKWYVGDTRTIVWQATGLGAVNISLETDSNNGRVVTNIANNVQASNGTYYWTIPSSAAGRFGNVYVRSADNAGTVYSFSNVAVQINSTSLTVVSPGGGEGWTAGHTYSIAWDSPASSAVSLEITGPNCSTSIVSGYPATKDSGSGHYAYNWAIPNPTPCIGSGNQIKITSSDPAAVAYSSPFTIVRPLITVTAPNGSETVVNNYNVTWNSVGVTSVNIYGCYNNYGIYTCTILSDGYTTAARRISAIPGTYSWNANNWHVGSYNINKQSLKIRIEDADHPGIFDESDYWFSVPDQRG